MLNRKELKEKKKYLINKLKDKNITNEEYTKVCHSLMGILAILTENDNLINVRLFNKIDKLLFGLLTLLKNSHIVNIYDKVLIENNINLPDNYYYYLLQLLLNIKDKSIDVNYNDLKPNYISDEQVIELSKLFYKNIGNEEISLYADKILNDSSHYGFTDSFSRESRHSLGVTVYDIVFNKTYTSVVRTGDISMCQAFNHEIMHGIDFYIAPHTVYDNYCYFTEAVTYTIDYLYLDYLDDMGFDHNQVDLLRKHKNKLVIDNAEACFKEICRRLKDNKFTKDSIKHIKNIIDEGLLQRLLKIESSIIAYGLYKQVLLDKEKGLNNIYKLTKYQIPNNTTPDFSFIDLSKDKILELSREITSIDYLKSETRK